jgi:D-beta-D-heptose 7-phosphate kinase/D-beta-D-heptose 1-phosphate adenosyltransferase
VVFTNGCFDLLHFGHHHLLNQARKLGGCLVVAVNSDASIRRLKGPDRPINSQEERMLMLSGLEAVDCVILFDEDTPLALLEALRPEVLVKGGEYRGGGVVGRELVESYGGRVELVEQVPGISTTAILEMRKHDRQRETRDG